MTHPLADFEIPVRNPRSFATDIISPDLLNKPRKRAKQGDDHRLRADQTGQVQRHATRQSSVASPSSPVALSPATSSSTGAGAGTGTGTQQQRSLAPSSTFASGSTSSGGAQAPQAQPHAQRSGSTRKPRLNAATLKVPSRARQALQRPLDRLMGKGKAARTPEQHRKKLERDEERARRRPNRTGPGSGAGAGASGRKGGSRSEAKRQGAKDAARAQASAESRGTNAADEEGQEDFEDLSTWSPFDHGSRTSTLRLETVLFTLYYPSSYDPERDGVRGAASRPKNPPPKPAHQSKDGGRTYEVDDSAGRPNAKQQNHSSSQSVTSTASPRYSHAAWCGRPKRTSMRALTTYVGQYGPISLLVSPAIASLLNASLPALVGPPLAEPNDERLKKAAIFPTTLIKDAKGGKGDKDSGKKEERKAWKDKAGNLKVASDTNKKLSLVDKLIQRIVDVGGPVAHNGQSDTRRGTDTKKASELRSRSQRTKSHGDTQGEEGDDDMDATVDRVWSGNHDGVRWPVVIFSHGLAGSRLTYSQYCGELASHGVIVAAVEHRDGSGIKTLVRARPGQGSSTADQNMRVAEESERREANENQQHDTEEQLSAEEYEQQRQQKYFEQIQRYKEQKHRHHYGSGFGLGTVRGFGKKKSPFRPRKAEVPYLTFEKYKLRSFATEPTEEESGLRNAQLAMRIAEIEECKHVLQRLNDGEGYRLYLESTRGLGSKLADKRVRIPPPDSIIQDPKGQLARFKGKLDMDFPLLVGHSFGGATVVQAQRTMDPPFPAAILLDPWCEPIPVDSERPVSAVCLSAAG